jgi:hypothetical protein
MLYYFSQSLTQRLMKRGEAKRRQQQPLAYFICLTGFEDNDGSNAMQRRQHRMHRKCILVSVC